MYSSNNAMVRPKCGEIWMCNLPFKDGSIQAGYRPVFILSNNQNNTYATTLNVIPLTTKMNKRKLPIHVELWDYNRFGLKAPSTMLVEQVMTVRITDLDKPIGSVEDKQTLASILKAMSIQFPIITMVAAMH